MKSTLAVFLLLAVSTFAQNKPASPPATATATVNGKSLSIAYSQPSVRGRKIMGGLVPYGEVWRTGANSSTTLTTEIDLKIGDTKVPAGKYSIYSLPSEGTWKLIINKQTGQWGTEYHPEQDFARIDMKKESLSEPVETFVISFEPQSDPKNIVLKWENTKLSVPITAAK